MSSGPLLLMLAVVHIPWVLVGCASPALSGDAGAGATSDVLLAALSAKSPAELVAYKPLSPDATVRFAERADGRFVVGVADGKRKVYEIWAGLSFDPTDVPNRGPLHRIALMDLHAPGYRMLEVAPPLCVVALPDGRFAVGPYDETSGQLYQAADGLVTRERLRELPQSAMLLDRAKWRVTIVPRAEFRVFPHVSRAR